MTGSKPLRIDVEFVVQTYDVDYLGIAHNIVYIRWLEELRLAVMAPYYPLEEMMTTGLSPVLERTEIDYRRPLKLFDRPTGYMWISNLTRARWEVEAELTLGDQLIATAKQKGYIVDLERLRPVPIPKRVREAWLAAVDPATLGK